jgi:thermitase
VINLSLGGAGDSQVLDSIIHAAHQQGVMFFGAAGNQPTTDPTYPAAFPDVVAVTAGDQQGNIASYANRGSFVDLIAPGTSVVDYQGQSYLVRGTSAATAYVSGTAAGFRAEGAAPQNVQAQLQQMLGIKPRGP